VDRLQLDTNGDGAYDQELVGQDARDYAAQHPWPDA
jgi:hypothetical protein